MNINETILFGCPIYKIKVDPTSYDKESLLKKIIINNYSIDVNIETIDTMIKVSSSIF